MSMATTCASLQAMAPELQRTRRHRESRRHDLARALRADPHAVALYGNVVQIVPGAPSSVP